MLDFLLSLSLQGITQNQAPYVTGPLYFNATIVLNKILDS